MAPAVVRRGS